MQDLRGCNKILFCDFFFNWIESSLWLDLDSVDMGKPKERKDQFEVSLFQRSSARTGTSYPQAQEGILKAYLFIYYFLIRVLASTQSKLMAYLKKYFFLIKILGY
jgi:hypothetical protein